MKVTTGNGVKVWMHPDIVNEPEAQDIYSFVAAADYDRARMQYLELRHLVERLVHYAKSTDREDV